MELTGGPLDAFVPPAGGCLDYLVRGSGPPTTVFAHGIAGSIAETRPFGAGVPGCRVFFHFRGHGGSRGADDRWDYAALAGELDAVAAHAGATRAFGVSLGAGALTRLLADRPDRFSRAVFLLPAALDRPRDDAAVHRFDVMAALVEAGDVPRLAAMLLDELPPAVRASREARRHAEARASAIAGTPLTEALRRLPRQAPVPDRSVLAAVAVPALVIGQEGDDRHPAQVARDLAAAIPGARLHVFGAPGARWHAPQELRALIAGFLAA